MNLISIYTRPDRHELLWRLLSERDPEVNISHRKMPSWDEHVAFVDSQPYEAWYFIPVDYDRVVVGACYLTKSDEIGIHIWRPYRSEGHAPKAVEALMKLHGERRYLANINPLNARSAAMFQKLGFELVQHTYARSV